VPFTIQLVRQGTSIRSRQTPCARKCQGERAQTNQFVCWLRSAGTRRVLDATEGETMEGQAGTPTTPRQPGKSPLPAIGESPAPVMHGGRRSCRTRLTPGARADKCALIFEEYTSLPDTQARVHKATKVLEDHEEKLLTGDELGTWTEERKLPLAVAATVVLGEYVIPDPDRPFDPPTFLTMPPKPTTAPESHPHPLRLVAALLGHQPTPADGNTTSDSYIYGTTHDAVKRVANAAGVPRDFVLVSRKPEGGRQTIGLSQYGLHQVVWARRSDPYLFDGFTIAELFGVFARAIRGHKRKVRLARNPRSYGVRGRGRLLDIASGSD
jgi:hypothetical protein